MKVLETTTTTTTTTATTTIPEEAGRKRKDGAEECAAVAGVKKGGGCKRARRRVQADSAAIQRLFDICKTVFKGPGTVPAPDHVLALCHHLDRMKPEDVGLSKDISFFRMPVRVGMPRITCTTIYECKNFSLCIFFLPATAVIPLHNHPGMTVFSKLLLGSMHIKAYDWADPSLSDKPLSPSELRLAKLKVDSEFRSPCSTAVLYPTSGGNMHEFTAITPCAVLDVLGPPYSTPDGRDCMYYKDHPILPSPAFPWDPEDAEGHAWLEEVEPPKSLRMTPVEYLGPPIIDS